MMRRLIAYSPPYGENYLADLETAEFMHRCGIDVVKLILSNSFSRLGIPYSPYPPLWTGPDEYHFDVAERQITAAVQQLMIACASLKEQRAIVAESAGMYEKLLSACLRGAEISFCRVTKDRPSGRKSSHRRRSSSGPIWMTATATS